MAHTISLLTLKLRHDGESSIHDELVSTDSAATDSQKSTVLKDSVVFCVTAVWALDAKESLRTVPDVD